MRATLSFVASARRFLLALPALLIAGAAALLAPLPATAQNAPVALNTPPSLSGAISPGMTRLELPFTVNDITRLRLDMIVPVDGATFALVDPNGAFVFVPGDSRLVFNPGALLPKPLPGGVFETPDIASPINGTWRVVLAFPPAPQPTLAFGTVIAVSRWQVGVAIERNVLLVGEDLGIGLAVLDNGQPVTGLAPTISVTKVGAAPGAAQAALDDGAGADGRANDGIYSIDNTFTSAGQYVIEGRVTIPGAGGPVQRVASQRVQVNAPTVDSPVVQLSTQLGSGNCVANAVVTVGVNVLKAGNYSALVRLAAPDGRTIDQRKALALAVGPATFSASFSAKSVKESFVVDGPYNVSLIDMLALDGDDLALAFRRRNAGAFNLALASFCAQPIEIAGPMTTTPVLKGNFIGSLNLAFPIRVALGGSYQISFKLIGDGGADFGLVNASRSLPAGLSTVSVNVAHPGFLSTDGPYQAISLVVVGGGSSARVNTLGTTPAYSRWQFYPPVSGDLNNDGSVNAADNALLNGFRNQPALRPGDRRDLNNDGIIDLRDGRELQKLVCTAPNCPVNP